MPAHDTLELKLKSTNPRYLAQVLYALRFADTAVKDLTATNGTLQVLHAAPDAAALKQKVESILERYLVDASALRYEPLWQHGENTTPPHDPFDDMLMQQLVNVEGSGRVALRGVLAELAEFIDFTVLRRIARTLGCRREVYPGTIALNDLGNAGVFQSLPQHMQFVAHLRHDLAAIDAFSKVMKESDFSGSAPPTVPDATLTQPEVLLNPAVCYHCYLTLRGQRVNPAGHAVTARSRCHRFEGASLKSLSRLADFDMRELVFVGSPPFVKEMRARATELTKELFVEWGLEGALVPANDPFFTEEYRAKALMQQAQDLKHELTVPLPDGAPLAISSFNYHMTHFTAPFDITGANGRPAASACIGYGLERWVYAIAMRHGIDEGQWPTGLKSPFDDWRKDFGNVI
ncbi:MAG: hypothetical protein HUU29_12245 [Planctomycetaceae bacterium]|nr:hypothetical protein [Planctomycetaceae bacterium]